MMKAYSYNATGSDGFTYSVRLMLEDVELEALQRVGIIGAVSEVVGMQPTTDALIAELQKEFYTACGGLPQ